MTPQTSFTFSDQLKRGSNQPCSYPTGISSLGPLLLKMLLIDTYRFWISWIAK